MHFDILYLWGIQGLLNIITYFSENSYKILRVITIVKQERSLTDTYNVNY